MEILSASGSRADVISAPTVAVIQHHGARHRPARGLDLVHRRYTRVLFFFQAEDGIRDLIVTGVQTCALPIFSTPNGAICPRRPIGGFRRRGHIAPFGVETAGRWSRVRAAAPLPEEAVAEAVAWQLLRRYGVVFRRLVTRETLLTPWRDILRVYRRLEARGEIRGGRFVGGFSGEQYALPGAGGVLPRVPRQGPRGQLGAARGGGPPHPVG